MLECESCSNGCVDYCQSNDERADWAEAAVNEFRRVCPGDMDETAIYDLIANLGHLTDRWRKEGKFERPMSFQNMLDAATLHYEGEQPTTAILPPLVTCWGTCCGPEGCS